MLHPIKDALRDIGDAVRRRRVWMALAAEDIGDAHRRTLLGPLWLLLNYLAFVGVIVLIIRSAGGIEHYTAYVACGLLAWLFISETISGGVMVFFNEESLIKGTPLPTSLYVMRQTTRSVIRFAYALAGAAGILLFSDLVPSAAWLTSVLAILLLLATAPAATILLGTAGVIFPDLQHFVSNLMRLGFFLTPVFWSHENAGGLRAALYHWNPFSHYLDIFRLPIVSGSVPPASWAICLCLSALLWLCAILVLGVYRKKIVFMI